MCKKLLVLVLVLGITGSASAATAVADGDWTDSATWDPGVPSFSDPAYINGHTVAIGPGDDYCEASSLFDGPAGQGLSTINQSGGQLHLNGYWFGEAGAGSGGLYNLTGGTLLVEGAWGNALEIGSYSGSTGTLNVSGTGSVTAVTGTLRLGINGGSGYVNISGTGSVDVPDIRVDTGFNLDMQDDGVLYLAGNKLEYFCSPANGDSRFYVAIMSGIMTANGGYSALSDFVRWYDIGLDKTVIRVPEPATIALLGLGGLALIRRKR